MLYEKKHLTTYIISDTISSDLLFIGVGSSIMPLATKYS